MLDHFRLVARHALLGGLLLLAACGGGGGDGGGPSGPGDGFVGPYHVVTFEGVRNEDGYSRAGWGVFVADPGSGLVEGATDQNVYAPPVPPTGSDIVGPEPFGPSPFWIRGDQDLTIEESTWYEGGASEDGRVAGLVAGGAGDAPALLLMVRREGTFSAASLSGAWHFFLFGHDHAADAGVAYRGTATFDAAGGASVTIEERNQNGTILGALAPVDTTWTLAPDGTMTWKIGDVAYQGGVLAGAQLAVLAGSTEADDTARGLLVLIRKSSTADVSLFSGRYERVYVARRAGTGWDCTNEEVFGGGNGSWFRAGGFSNGDGVLIPRPATTPFSHTVDPDGTWIAGDTHGAVSPDGRFAAWMVFGGGTLPGLSFLVR